MAWLALATVEQQGLHSFVLWSPTHAPQQVPKSCIGLLGNNQETAKQQVQFHYGGAIAFLVWDVLLLMLQVLCCSGGQLG